MDDDSIRAGRLKKLYKNSRKFSTEAGKNLATFLMDNPGIALESGSKIGCVVLFQNRVETLSVPSDLINFLSKRRIFSWDFCADTNINTIS